jgi:hypothetical protein
MKINGKPPLSNNGSEMDDAGFVLFFVCPFPLLFCSLYFIASDYPFGIFKLNHFNSGFYIFP